MSECIVCHGKRLRAETVDKMFNVGGCYVLVTGMPSTVCRDCGERSFSREATERARLLAHDPPEDVPVKSAPLYRGTGQAMQVYDFA